MKFTHIIWDWNGTLLNDAWLSVEILNALLEKRGFNTLSLERYRETFDFPVSKFYESLGFDFSTVSMEEVGRDFVASYNARRTQCAMQSGALDLLGLISDTEGVDQSILSAYEKSLLLSAVRDFKIEGLFGKISGLENIYAGSKVELGKAHMRSIHADPGRTLMVGDTTHDFEVSKAIGVSCALLSCGHHSRKRLERTGAAVFDSISGLRGFLTA